MARVCDRCGKMASEEIEFSRSKEKFDLCHECNTGLLNFLRPAKDDDKIDPTFKAALDKVKPEMLKKVKTKK